MSCQNPHCEVLLESEKVYVDPGKEHEKLCLSCHTFYEKRKQLPTVEEMENLKIDADRVQERESDKPKKRSTVFGSWGSGMIPSRKRFRPILPKPTPTGTRFFTNTTTFGVSSVKGIMSHNLTTPSNFQKGSIMSSKISGSLKTQESSGLTTTLSDSLLASLKLSLDPINPPLLPVTTQNSLIQYPSSQMLLPPLSGPFLPQTTAGFGSFDLLNPSLGLLAPPTQSNLMVPMGSPLMSTLAMNPYLAYSGLLGSSAPLMSLAPPTMAQTPPTLPSLAETAVNSSDPTEALLTLLLPNYTVSTKPNPLP